MYGPRGWTDHLIQAIDRLGLRNPHSIGGDYIGLKPIDAQTFLALMEWVPESNLEDCQNAGPSLRTFIALAEKEPAARFSGYIITANRDDERLTISEVFVPATFDFAGTGIVPTTADEDYMLASGQRRLWWD